MFEYNSVNDEYSEVFQDNTVLDKATSYKGSYSVISTRSSRHSIRSLTYAPPPRIITRRGRLNIYQTKRVKKNFIYFRDLGNTLLNIRWRWIILALFVVNFISFFAFGLMWMLMAYISGDFEEDTEEFCIVNTKTFTGYLLLSVETMLTIGYGYRYPTEQCFQGWIVPFLQALISIGIQGALVSAIYVKIAKPITKNFMGLFSKKAVICLRDGKLCFIVRITDPTGKIAIGTNIRMYFINKDENNPAFQIRQLKVEPYGFPIFPIEIVHVINPQSPFYNLTPQDFLIDPFEVIVVAEGISQITAQASQNRISYTNCDILWGHRFVSCVNFDNKNKRYVVKKGNEVCPVDTPLCSAQMLSVIGKALLVQE